MYNGTRQKARTKRIADTFGNRAVKYQSTNAGIRNPFKPFLGFRHFPKTASVTPRATSEKKPYLTL